MPVTTPTILDQEELIHLAIHASKQGRDDHALSILKTAIERDDAGVQAHYLIGTLYAQLGLHRRAADAIEVALTVQQDFPVARLQLGLIYLVLNDADLALERLAPLANLNADNPLGLFGRGLIHLCEGHLDLAASDLAKGIRLNAINIPLNADIQRVIDQINISLTPREVDTTIEEPPEADAGNGHSMLLSAYVENKT